MFYIIFFFNCVIIKRSSGSKLNKNKVVLLSIFFNLSKLFIFFEVIVMM